MRVHFPSHAPILEKSPSIAMAGARSLVRSCKRPFLRRASRHGKQVPLHGFDLQLKAWLTFVGWRIVVTDEWDSASGHYFYAMRHMNCNCIIKLTGSACLCDLYMNHRHKTQAVLRSLAGSAIKWMVKRSAWHDEKISPRSHKHNHNVLSRNS